MGCTSSHQRPPRTRTPGSRLTAIWPLPEDLQDLNIEASDSSKTITAVDGTLSLPMSSLAKPTRPLPEDHENSELQVEVLDPSKTITTPVGIFSLPAELMCHILLLLHFKDLSCCVLACKTFWHVAQNFADIQCLFELYAQGFTETPTLDWVDVSSKMYSLKRLASMWRSDFHLNPIFEAIVAIDIINHSSDMQSVKCGLWWICGRSRVMPYWETCPPIRGQLSLTLFRTLRLQRRPKSFISKIMTSFRWHFGWLHRNVHTQMLHALP
ncbi:hypothetical protein BDR03DRAFT_644877 [Suillus americanus]|nr:hypothetical protein BDR03DRAFT_644877 [Suillus americanus]